VERYVGLDLLRGLSAISILLYHLSGQSLFFSGLYIFTDIFFMISGYVLLPTYPNPENAAQRKKWIIHRLIRLQPILLISTVFTIILVVLSGSQRVSVNITSIVGSIFLMQVFIPAAQALNTPLWSLSSEMIVNLLFLICSKKKSTILLLIFLLIGFQALAYLTVADLDYSSGITAVVRCATSFLIGVFLRILKINPIIQLVSRFWPISAILGYLTAVLFGEKHLFLSVGLMIPMFWKFTQLNVKGALKPISTFGRKYSYAFFVVHFPLVIYSDTLRDNFLSLYSEFYIWKVLQFGLVSIASLILAIVFSSLSKNISRTLLTKF